jgi:hypothetical protein
VIAVKLYISAGFQTEGTEGVSQGI